MADMKPHGRTDLMGMVGGQAINSGCAHIVFIGGVNRQIFEAAVNRPLVIEQLSANPEVHADSLNLLKQQETEYLTHPADWYRFNNELLIYHTITDTWITESQSPLLARAGAGVTKLGNEWIIVDGESKPGVRSADVTAVKMTVRPSFGWLNWTVLIAYLIGMVLLGYYFMRREGDADDFSRAVVAFPGGQRASAFTLPCSAPSLTWLIRPRPTPLTGPTTPCLSPFYSCRSR